jgi:mono/diheme cytochrome c family protein
MMRWRLMAALLALVVATNCTRKAAEPDRAEAKAFGAALVEVSGGKQIAAIGTALDQPLVVQVNDAQGAAVAGAAVSFRAGGGATVTPAEGLTGSDGQLTVSLALGGVAGRYQVTATTRNKAGKAIELRSEEIALGYQQNLGRQLNDRYCSRCHDPESTAERVSNHDNLNIKPHVFTDGDFLNKIIEADLASIITHGGAALNKSAEMPPYGSTLNKADIEALVAYIRAVADPPYRLKGLVYAKN